MTKRNNIVFIGSGNLATSLAVTLHEAGKKILQVYSKTLVNAQLLANKIGANATNLLSDINLNADLYIIAVPDNEIQKVITAINFGNKLVIHTSGATPLSVFEGQAKNFGVLYPLQTFSKTRIIDDFTHIPIFIEGSTDEIRQDLHSLAQELSQQVHDISSEQRLILHTSGIFACNFVNHLFTLTTDLLQQNGLNKEWIRPLVEETVSKALSSQHPKDVQTGPASRGDHSTIEQHIDILITNPELQTIYTTLTNSIMTYVSPKQKINNEQL